MHWVRHMPWLQTWAAVHAVVQLPQWSWLLASCVSHPLAAFMSQSP